MHDPTLGLASAMTNLSPVNLNAVLDRSPAHDMMSPGKGVYRATYEWHRIPALITIAFVRSYGCRSDRRARPLYRWIRGESFPARNISHEHEP